MLQEGICKLCGLKKPLLKKSHILPEHMYEPFYGAKHKFYKIPVHQTEDRVKRLSSGFYESNILCEFCDNELLGGLESYGAKVFYSRGILRANEIPITKRKITPDGLVFTSVNNIDYTKTKLYLLSLIFRASISKLDFFHGVNLGPHEKVIAKMILTNNAGGIEEYPINCLTYLDNNNIPKDIIGYPRKHRHPYGYSYYSLLIRGIIYQFYINSKNHQLAKDVLGGTINKNNEMFLLHLPQESSQLFFDKYVGFKRNIPS